MTQDRQKLIDRLIALANKVSKDRNIAIATVSGLVSGDARFISKIKNGGNFTIDRYETAITKLQSLLDGEEA